MDSVYTAYDFSLLTHVAYFAYEVNPRSGGYTSIHGWLTNGLVAHAKQQNPKCKVLLTASCFGTSADSLMENPTAQKALIANLQTLILAQKGDGVCIDFESLSPNNATAFTTFIQQIATSFHAKGLLVTITLPAIDYNGVYNIKALNPNVDLYILMGYDYFSGASHITGPVAPLKNSKDWISYSIESSVDTYLGKSVPDSCLLLGLPYFGAIWQTKTKAIPDTVLSFLGYRPYSYAVTTGLAKFKGDGTTQSLYYTYFIKEDSTHFRQYWTDGVNSLSSKYDYVLKKKIGGIGIWALGFDNGSDDLWKLLKTKFSVPGGSLPDSLDLNQLPASLESNPILGYIRRMPVAAGLIVFAALCTLLVVLLKVLSDPANTTILKAKGLYYVLFLACLLVTTFALFILLWFGFKLSLSGILIVFGVLVLLGISLGLNHSLRQRNMP